MGRRRLTHDPALAAASWLIPVINLWFPYQAHRDLLAEDDPERSRVLLWWLLYLGGSLPLVFVFVVALFSVPVALVLGLAAVSIQVLTGFLGARVTWSCHRASVRLAGNRAEPDVHPSTA